MDESRLSSRYVPALDGLRALACVAVIACHANYYYGGIFASGRIDGLVSAVFRWGWVGVHLFFVLSGFLITGILWDTKRCEGFFRNFYARRTLRIMPLYFGYLSFAVVIGRLFSSHFAWIHLDDFKWLASFTYNFHVGVTGRHIEGFAHFWSLAVEEQFYLIWPLVIWALHRRALMGLCLGVADASFLLLVRPWCSAWSCRTRKY